MKVVIGQLVLHPKENKAGTGNTKRKAKNVQEAIAFVFPKLAYA